MDRPLAEILQQPIDEATRLVVRHERVATFRWLGLVEIVFSLLVFCCVIVPFALIVLLLSGGDADVDGDIFELPSWDRLHYHWHDLIFSALDAQGNEIASGRTRLMSEAGADTLMSAILVAADRQNVMVVETLGSNTSAPLALWYGGRPLLAEAGLPTTDRIAARLAEHDVELERDDKQTVVRVSNKPRSRLWLTLQLLTFLVGLPLMVMPAIRRLARSAWLEWNGHGPPTWSATIQADYLAVRSEQGPVVFEEVKLAGHRILGFAWSRVLTTGSQAEVHGPKLRAALVDGFAELPVSESIGPIIRDLLTRETLDWRARRPELGLTHGEPPATRCPYCGALYIFRAGEACPSCGGWPDKVG